MTHIDVMCRVEKSERSRIRGLSLVEARILATEKLAQELFDAAKKEGENSVVDKDTQRALKVLMEAVVMLKGAGDSDAEALFHIHDCYAEKFKRSKLFEIVSKDADNVVECMKLTIHKSLNGQAVPYSRALDLRTALTSIKLMEYLGEELLHEPAVDNNQIDCQTKRKVAQAEQIRQILESILQILGDLKNHKDTQAIVSEYDRYASKKKWQCMQDAISADLEKIKIVDRAFVQECKAWQYDRH